MLSDGPILSEREVLAASAELGLRGAAPTNGAAGPGLDGSCRSWIATRLNSAAAGRRQPLSGGTQLGISRRALYRRLGAFGLR